MIHSTLCITLYLLLFLEALSPNFDILKYTIIASMCIFSFIVQTHQGPFNLETPFSSGKFLALLLRSLSSTHTQPASLHPHPLSLFLLFQILVICMLETPNKSNSLIFSLPLFISLFSYCLQIPLTLFTKLFKIVPLSYLAPK